MPSAYTRRSLLSVCGAGLGLGTAGCLGNSPSDSGSTETTTATTSDRTTTTKTTSTTPTPTPIPRSVVSDSEAKDRALAAEKEYLTDQLKPASCLDNWGTSPTTASKRATVAERTAEAVRVEVVHPYSYSTDRTEADGASHAEYLVTAEETTRVNGDVVSPC